jgi:exopolysaccharide biosynthesis polyprenyl glycosylphosphotransferase
MEAISEVLQSVNYKDTPLAATRNIRVLLVITGLATGGATNVVLDIANHFKNQPEFDVQLLTGPIPPGRNDVTHLAYDLGISTQVIPSLINQINPIANLKAIADIRRIMVEGKYDIVHTHSSVAGVVGRLAAVAAGVPVIVHHVHGWGLHDGMPGWTRVLYLVLERLCAKYTDRIIAVSKPDIQKGLIQGIAKKDKFSLIYNGIDLEKFRQEVEDQQLRAELGLDPDSKLVGMIGRLDQQKNPLDLIEAASIVVKRYPKVQFLVVGDGSLRPDCERLIDELKLKDKFFLLGFRSDVEKILPILTVTAMSSLWEGLPLAFLEAMSAGRPIVANDIDGASDVVVNGETGYLVTPHKPEEMAERILTLLNDETLCDEMGRVAQQRSENYSLQSMVGKIGSLYKELHFAPQTSVTPLRRLLSWTSGRALETNQLGPEKPNFFGRVIERYSRFQAPFSERRLMLGLGDVGSILMAQVFAFFMWGESIYSGGRAIFNQHAAWYLMPPFLAVWFVFACFNDLYHIPTSYNKRLALRRIVQTTILTMFIYAGVLFLFPQAVPPSYYPRIAFLLIPLVVVWRFTYAVVFKWTPFRQRVLLVGKGSRSEAAMRDIQMSTWVNYDVVGYVHDVQPKNRIEELQYLGRSNQLLSVIKKFKIHEIVVTNNGRLKDDLFKRLVECQANGVRVNWMPEFYERLYQRIPIEHIDPSWAFYMMQNRPVFNRFELGFKRLFDLLLLILALPVLLLVILPIALAIKLESKGPAFYRQLRCGRAGELFTIYKFRTMVVDAEIDGKARWATKDDPRITRMGRLLRKSRLDELPQLLNVLRGDMTIVGPRPERPEFVEQLEAEIPFYRTRLVVKPGITGWAQINYDYGNTIGDALMKLQYDFFYVRHWSIWMDLYILFRTAGVVLQLKGT